MAVPRRLRNTNTHPENGSSASFSWQNRAKESMPLRPSTGSMATNTRICAVIWIILPYPARRAASRPNPVGRPPSSGCASCLPCGLELDDAVLQRRRMRRDQFHECRLGCLSSEAGNSTEPFLQAHIVQAKRVRDGVHTVLPGEFDRSLPEWLRQLRSLRLGATELIQLALQLRDRLGDRLGAFWV